MHIDKKLLRNLFALAAGCVVLVWVFLYTAKVLAVLDYIWSLISPFVAGACIAFVFNVPMRAIESHLLWIRKPGIRRALAILLTLAAMALVIAFVVELLLPQIQATIESLAQTIPAFFRRQATNIQNLLAENPELQQWLYENVGLDKLIQLDWGALIEKATSVVGSGLSTILTGAFSAIGSVTGAIVNSVISIAFAVYCLAGKENLARQGRRILYSVLSEHTADEAVRVLRLTNSTFSNFISGQCLEACILGCLFAVAMLLFKMPYIPLVSVVIAVTALIPVVGAFVGCVVGAFFILVSDPLQAVSFVVMFLVIQQLEGNLIYPRVVGSSVGLPGMWVLVAVTVGGELMGVGGMLIMIPLASVLYTLGREATGKRLAQRQIPEDKLQAQPPEIKSGLQKSQEAHSRRRFQVMKEQFQRLQEKRKK